MDVRPEDIVSEAFKKVMEKDKIEKYIHYKTPVIVKPLEKGLRI
jgi:hypothetical protein